MVLELRQTPHTSNVPFTQGVPEVPDLTSAALAVEFSSASTYTAQAGTALVPNQDVGGTVALADVVSVASDGTDITLTVDTSVLDITAAANIYYRLSITQPD